jgi:hypothetical protein
MENQNWLCVSYLAGNVGLSAEALGFLYLWELLGVLLGFLLTTRAFEVRVLSRGHALLYWVKR